MSDLSKIRIGFSSLSGKCYLYRHGKDPQVALDKREATPEVQAAIVEMMMDGAPKGASQKVTFGNGWYEITVKPCKRPRGWRSGLQAGVTIP